MQSQDNLTPPPVTLKPGVFSAYGNGWTQLWRHFWMLLLIGIIYVVIGIVGNVPQLIAEGTKMFDPEYVQPVFSIYFLINLLYGIFVGIPLTYGIFYAFLKAARADDIEIKDMFEGFRSFWNAIGAYLIVTIIILVGCILLIVPGIIFTCKLIFVPYLVVDKKMSVFKALDASWRMTNGHAWKVFLIGLILFGMFFIIGFMYVIISIIFFTTMGFTAGSIIGMAFFCIIGILLEMWFSTAIASLYYAVDLEKNMSPAAEMIG